MAKSTDNNRANQGARNCSNSGSNTEKGCCNEKTANKAPNAKKTQG